MPGKTTVKLRISDMLRFMYENIVSIGAGTEGLQLIKEYNHWEEEEDNLIEHLGKTDSYAYCKAVRIDTAQDKIIDKLMELFILVIAENQASNKLIEHYDPKAMQERVKEERKRIESQFLLFKGGEEIEKTRTKCLEKSNRQIPDSRYRQSKRSSEEPIRAGMEFIICKGKSGEGTAIPHRSV